MTIDRVPTWEEVAREHGQFLFTVAYRLTGNVDDARDLVQEALLRVRRGLATYEPGSLEGWLARIVTNVFLDDVRRRKRRPIQALPDQPDLVLPASEAADTAADTAGLSTEIQAAIAALPEEFRVPVVLCDVADRSYEDIAADARRADRHGAVAHPPRSQAAPRRARGPRCRHGGGGGMSEPTPDREDDVVFGVPRQRARAESNALPVRGAPRRRPRVRVSSSTTSPRCGRWSASSGRSAVPAGFVDELLAVGCRRRAGRRRPDRARGAGGGARPGPRPGGVVVLVRRARGRCRGRRSRWSWRGRCPVGPRPGPRSPPRSGSTRPVRPRPATPCPASPRSRRRCGSADETAPQPPRAPGRWARSSSWRAGLPSLAADSSPADAHARPRSRRRRHPRVHGEVRIAWRADGACTGRTCRCGRSTAACGSPRARWSRTTGGRGCGRRRAGRPSGRIDGAPAAPSVGGQVPGARRCPTARRSPRDRRGR